MAVSFKKTIKNRKFGRFLDELFMSLDAQGGTRKTTT
jgi:hypothetical protein